MDPIRNFIFQYSEKNLYVGSSKIAQEILTYNRNPNPSLKIAACRACLRVLPEISVLFLYLLLTTYILLRIPTNDVNGGQSLFEILNGYVLKFHKCCEALSLIFCCCGVAKHHVQFNLRSNKIGQAVFFCEASNGNSS